MIVKELLQKANLEKVLDMFNEAKEAYAFMWNELLNKKLIPLEEPTIYAVRKCFDDFEDGNGVIVDCYTHKGFFALDFIPWGKVLNFTVSELSLQDYSIDMLTYYLLDELSFYGVTEGSMEDERAKLDEAIAEVESGNTESFVSMDEAFPEFKDLPPYTPTPEDLHTRELHMAETERYTEALNKQLENMK